MSSGSIVQLNHYQHYDYILTDNPEITFFRTIYRQYTHFGKITLESLVDTPVDFGNRCSIKIPKQHDLLSDVIIKIKLPTIDISAINEALFEKYKPENYEEYETNYNFFISFKRKLQYIVNDFFSNVSENSTTFVEDLNTYIGQNIQNSDFFTYFMIVDFFMPSLKNNMYYKNASLYKSYNDELRYNYETFDMTIDLFKITINKNMTVLNNTDRIFYDIVKNITMKKYVSVSWIENIAIHMFEYINLYVGSNLIVSLPPEYIESHGSLKYTSQQLYKSLINYDFQNQYCYLKVPFWFAEHYSCAFPLVALQFNDVFIKFKIKNYRELLSVTLSDKITMNELLTSYSLIETIEEQLKSFDMRFLFEYIALDSFERQKFIQSGHEYLINEINQIDFTNVTQYTNNLKLNFHHCIRDIRWFVSPEVEKTQYFIPIQNQYTYTTLFTPASTNQYYLLYLRSFDPQYIYDTYEILQIESIVETLWKNQIINSEIISNNYDDYKNSLIQHVYGIACSMQLNSYVLFNYRHEFFNYLHPYCYYNVTPKLGTNIYSFSLYPLDMAPSGSFNIGRISNVLLKPIINNINSKNETYKVKVIVTGINVLRVIGGICNKAFTY